MKTLGHLLKVLSQIMCRFFAFLFALLTLPALAQQSTWYVLSREDGCMDLKILAKAEKLSRAPASPDDFAELMRERGEMVSIGMPPGFPSELAGKVVQINIDGFRAPVFVKEEICRNIDK